MRESSTYQGILQEGRDEGLVKGRVEGRVETLRQSIRDLGEMRFGPIPSSLGVDLDTASDADRLARVMKRLLFANDWEDLMATPRM
jgi:predicted transposase YdaD